MEEDPLLLAADATSQSVAQTVRFQAGPPTGRAPGNGSDVSVFTEESELPASYLGGHPLSRQKSSSYGQRKVEEAGIEGHRGRA